MSLNNQEPNTEESLLEKTKDENPSNQMPSATTPEIPSFGWSAYAERINGRFAMLGFIAVLLIELLSNESFLNWSGIIH
tara:strand:+ start:297 stop:533 length:237 start_codon:yes stop_codon:yes gene_type:complete